jgi:hypothetical protein
MDIFGQITIMKLKTTFCLLLIVFSFFTSLNSSAQTDTTSVKKDIAACADTMVKCFATGDYATLERFSNETAVKIIGGKEKFIEVVKQTMEGMEGLKIEDVSVGRILQVVKTPKGFQCLVEQKMTLLINDTRIKSISPLHGYADSIGKQWRFSDVGDKSPAVLKQFIPDLDKRLIIPKKVTTTEKI